MSRLPPVFQPSSDLTAGCDSSRGGLPNPFRCFNPHPTSQPDATLWHPARPSTCASFNPHPTSQPDATPAADLGWTPDQLFQPSSDLTAGCDVIACCLLFRMARVSTLIRPHSRMRLNTAIAKGARHARFQPSSDLTAGCDTRGATPNKRRTWFQPSSDLTAGCDC